MIPGVIVLANKIGAPGGGGGGGGGVSINNRTVSDIQVSAPATATYTLNSNGNAYDHNGTVLEPWLDSGAASDYQVRATQTSGDAITSGTLGTWMALSTSRSWSMSITTGELLGTLLVEIRDAGTLSVIDNASITLNAAGNTGT